MTTVSQQSGTSDRGTQESYAYCRDFVRKRDYEAFLTCHCYPTQFQDAFFALRAFHIELASIQESVSTSVIGRMRIQFWKDALKSFNDGSPPKHPIALALYDALRQAKLPMYHLKRIVDARDTELDVPSHMTVDSLTAHAESTSSTFLYLLLSLLSQSSSETFSHAASHVGIAQTISTLLRALPYHASKGHMVIPAEITARHGVSQEDVFRYGGDAKHIDDAVFEFATVANDHLITAREEFNKDCGGKVPEPVRPVFLSTVPAALYLERLEKCTSLLARHDLHDLELDAGHIRDGSSLCLVSKRFYTVTQDPYIRAWYFISRYGKIQAFYWALGRGRLMNGKVIDTLLSSGAHLSRYFVQCAMHHYYRTAQVPFIKTPWVRSMELAVFTHFQAAAVQQFGNIPLGKGDDDGSVVDAVIKESRFPIEQRQIKWETVREVLEKYKFIPFCHKDAMMANYPLVLAIEPRLLPYARANGFTMDHKYRNFVFRKMFEKPAISFEGRADEIVRNVKELSRLDPRMFLTRTVAAEICMEANINEQAYNALKRLDKEGFLRFELSHVVETLIKTFANTRSVASIATFNVLKELFQDFPSNDPLVRHVLILQVFVSETITSGLILSQPYYRAFGERCQQKIESIGLPPVDRHDLLEVLSSKFAPERFQGVIMYGRLILGMSSRAVDDLVREVSFRCLEIGCKGKMLKKIVELYPFVADAIRRRVMEQYRLNVDDLPPWEDENACLLYEAPLCQDFVVPRATLIERIQELSDAILSNAAPGQPHVQQQLMTQNASPPLLGNLDEDAALPAGVTVKDEEDEEEDEDDLGTVGQDSLSTMIRKDESAPARSRRRFYEFALYADGQGKLQYPADHMLVAKWIRAHYGVRSGVTAVFMLHSVINGSPVVMQPYLNYGESWSQENRVPITLKHFKLLARIGRAPPHLLFDEIEYGTEFYFSEEDYLPVEELNGTVVKSRSKKRPSRIKVKMVSEYSVKAEKSPTPTVADGLSACSASISGSNSSRRSMRNAASSISYIVPDSDDEMIADDGDDVMREVKVIAKKRKVESNLQKWIKNLTLLLKDEQRKYKEKKKLVHATAVPGTKIRVPKNEFYKNLAAALTRLRKTDKEKRLQLYGADIPDEDYSSGDEDEYQERTSRPSKRRKVDTS
ncbi:Squalene/phytoene synthase-domain-containing protein [Cytidiella melzeri]|nr:Squalene/phytoene synthase-domain-containing protein [Cytidiella melzeri]